MHFHNSRALGIGPRVFVTETSVVSSVIIVDYCSTSRQGYFQGPPIIGPLYGKYHTIPIYLGILMGVVWE